MYCPKCDEQLHLIERMGIAVDYCTSCGGVFLHEDDLDRIIDRTVWSARMDSAPKRKRGHDTRYYPDDDDDDERRRHRSRGRKKSLVKKAFKELKDIID